MVTGPTVDFEVMLYPHHVADSLAGYAVRCRISSPGEEADVDPLGGELVLVRLDFQALAMLAASPARYGKALSESFFQDEAMVGALRAAQSRADEIGTVGESAPVRIRLGIGPGDLRLHAVRWELMYQPDGLSPLFQGSRIHFSRYLSSGDWRRVRRRSVGSLRALVTVANPRDVAKYGPGDDPLRDIPVSQVVQEAEHALKGVRVTTLSQGQATWATISERLGEGFDVIFLVCHGALVDGVPKLWLEGSDGNADIVDGDLLVQRIRGLLQVPHLVVLASCQSAGAGRSAWEAENALAALGPRLAAVGVPAVVAMHGDVTMDTANQLLPAFFADLMEHGRIDQAMGVARVKVASRPDWWMPVLFTRLKTGRLWYSTGAADQADFRSWPGLLSAIQSGACVPIIGPALQDSLLGSRKEIALRWAEKNDIPMAIHERDDLPQVAQFLAISQKRDFVTRNIIEHLCDEIWRLYPTELAEVPELRETKDGATLLRLMTLVEQARWKDDPASPYRVLARLPVTVYITTSPSSLLEDALREAGRDPQTVICEWDRASGEPMIVGGAGAQAIPTVAGPLVFHVFGHFDDQFSLVLTEDNYFDFLIKFTLGRSGQPASTIPSAIALAMTKSLLFLGFQLEDWSFRVLFRLIMDYPGRRPDRFVQVAVQLEPEEDDLRKPEDARAHLEKYFSGSQIDVIWGGAEDFLRELHSRLPPKAPGS